MTLGPVEPEVIKGLEARKVEASWGPAASGWYETRGGQHYLKRVDGGCVFLKPDRTCAVHGLYGAEAKPGFCRAFPLHAVETSESVSVVVRSDCSGVHETMESGEPVSDQVASLLALKSPRARFEADAVEVLPGQSVPTATWLDWERELLATLADGAHTPAEAVALIRIELASRLGVSLPSADPARRRMAVRATAEGMRMVTARAVQQGNVAAEVAFAEENLRRLASVLASEAPPINKDTNSDITAYLGVLLRSFLLGKQYGASGLAPGLGLFLVTAEVAGASAGEPLALDALAHHLSRFSRFLNNDAIQQVVRAARPALVDVFLHTSG